MGWEAGSLRRLIRFLHGGPAFVQSASDFEEALSLADYLGMAAVSAQCNAWITEHLEAKKAPQLWSYLESQPRLHLEWHQETSDAISMGIASAGPDLQ